MKHHARHVPVIIIASLLISCSKNGQQQPETRTYVVRGELVAIDSAQSRVMIAHEEIPGYMMAMTMPFKVKNPDLSRGLAVGDSIVATLKVTQKESWLETLTVFKKAVAPEPPGPGGVRMRSEMQLGDNLPEIHLTNQNRRRITFDTFRGKVLALTFVNTRCPFPDFCPRTISKFVEVQKALSEDRSMGIWWHLLSITLDPGADTPDVLKEYAISYGIDESTWDFATGSPETLSQMADKFDLLIAKQGDLLQHNLRVVVADKKGRLVKMLKGNNWSTGNVIREMRKLALTDGRQPPHL